MAEYKSFHYLMHAVPEQIKPHYIQAPKALPFTELYSPRNGTTLLGKHEKSFWRTRDRIEFAIYENRSSNVVFVTCRNIDSQEAYRTIFLCAETLFFEVEVKASESETREKLVRKKDKVLNSDELLHKAATDYILARLLVTNDPLPWPDFTIPPPEQPTDSAPSSPVRKEPPALTSTEPVGPVEKMCTFSKISSDKYAYLEINKPPGLSLEGILHTKTEPSATNTATNTIAVAASSVSTAPASVSIIAAGVEAITITNIAPGSVPGATGSAPASAPTSPPSSAPTSARLNVPPLKLSGSRKTVRAVASATPTSVAAPDSTTNATVAVATNATTETSGAGANVSAPAKKVPSTAAAGAVATGAVGKTASAGQTKGRNTVIVKQNNTQANTKPNNSSVTTGKDSTPAAADVVAQESPSAVTLATTIKTDVSVAAVNNNLTKTTTTATPTTVTATANIVQLDTAVNPTERKKSVAASPSSQRNSILGNRNSKKVVPT